MGTLDSSPFSLCAECRSAIDCGIAKACKKSARGTLFSGGPMGSLTDGRSTHLICAWCGRDWRQELTDDLRAPQCPDCGYVGDRELSTRYPLGVLAGGWDGLVSRG